MALIDNLVAFWELESNGNDSHGTNHLTVNGSPSFVSAKVGNGVDLEQGSSQYLSLADNAALSLGSDEDFTMSVWFKMESDGGTDMAIVSKNGEYELFFDWLANTVRFVVTDNTAYGATSEYFGPSLATWYHVVGRHDATANLVRIRVNGGSDNTEATNPSGSHDGTGAFNIGGRNGAVFFDGVVDQVGLWKRHLSDAECDTLYNSGSGLSYAAMGGGGGGSLSIPVVMNQYRQRRA